MVNREQLLKFIPKPKNEDVIIYDTELSDLIDIDVFQEYEKTIYPFLNKQQEFHLIQAKIKEMEKFVNNVYLFNTSWSKEDYLIRLKNAKKTYSTAYKEINKIENNISVLNKKLDVMNEKIAIQETKEKKRIEDRKNTIDEEIEEDKKTLENLKEKLSFYTLHKKILNKEIEKNEEEFNFLSKMQADLKKGEYQCKFCGCYVPVNTENSHIYRRLEKNFAENKNNLTDLLNKKEDVDKEIAFYENEISKVKARLNNNIEFKKESSNFYIKKTVEVLKLEALRDEIINNISEQEKELKSKPQLKSNHYTELKNNIEKYELSLQNLDKIAEFKKSIKDDINNYDMLKKELTELYNKLNKYKSFITIYYKICERKANEYLGNDFKFKLYQFDDLVFKPIFEVKYKDIEYTQLSEEDRDECNKIFNEKISIFY